MGRDHILVLALPCSKTSECKTHVFCLLSLFFKYVGEIVRGAVCFLYSLECLRGHKRPFLSTFDNLSFAPEHAKETRARCMSFALLCTVLNSDFPQLHHISQPKQYALHPMCAGLSAPKSRFYILIPTWLLQTTKRLLSSQYEEVPHISPQTILKATTTDR